MPISSLRKNYREVIIGPRVRNLPHSYALTVFTHFFIIGGKASMSTQVFPYGRLTNARCCCCFSVSVGAVLLYTFLSTETVCQSLPLGQKAGTAGLQCESLQIRKDTSASVKFTSATSQQVQEAFPVGFQLFLTDETFLEKELGLLQVDPLLIAALE